MRFFLFILANALLFIRPVELIPGLGDLELYRYVIFACLIISLPILVQQVFTRWAKLPPIAGCVLGLLPAVVLSQAAQGNLGEAWDGGTEFFKVIVYFLLLLALVTTMARLQQFVYWIILFCAVLTVVAIVRYHGDLGQPAPPAVSGNDTDGPKKPANSSHVIEHERDAETGNAVDLHRMCGTGIFNDPNDLALVLITAIPLCLYRLTDPVRKGGRPFWAGLILLFGYALMLTSSRGGFIAMLAGIAVLLQLRYGGKKMIPLGMAIFPLLFVIFAGRMTTLSASEGTGQSRMQLWADGLQFLQGSPLFGIGMLSYTKFSRHVAHNSYLHCYVELGVVGGTMFVSAFYFALRGLYRLRPGAQVAVDPVLRLDDKSAVDTDPELHRIYPYLMAMFVSFSVGILFLSRSYAVPTYLILGLAVVYLRLRSTQMAIDAPDWSKLIIPRLAGISVSFLIATYTIVRVFVH